jgi:uncharacterized protein
MMMSTTMNPVSASERLSVIDQLRGFAIFGILVVNTFYFFHPFFSFQLGDAPAATERAAHFLITFLFVGKFYTLFSFLFGLGIHIQMSRAEARGARFVPIYLRRLFVLALIGLAHGTLLWIGDILLLYAGTGLLTLWLFRHRSPRTLKIWAIVLVSVLLFIFGLGVAAIQLARMAPSDSGAWEQVEQQFAESAQKIEQEVARDYAVYGSGGFAEITRERWDDYLELVLGKVGLWMLPSVLAMFLIGLRAGKMGWFDPGEKRAARMRGLLRWALPLGLLLNFYVAATGFEQSRMGLEVLSWQAFFQIASLTYGSICLALSWVALMILADGAGAAGGLRAALAPVGRMALTNYLLQSLVMTTLAYGYGFALFGKIGLAQGLVLAIALFALQVPLSRWWLDRFRFGPVEWLWRTLTYRQFQPMRR